MKQRVFDIGEMYRFGLSKEEAMDIIAKSFDAEVADRKQKRQEAQRIADAKRRVADDTYTVEDLLLLEQQIKNRQESAKAKAETVAAHEATENRKKIVSKVISDNEIDEIIKRLISPVTFG